MNIDECKNEAKNYVASGKYNSDIANVLDSAKKSVTTNLNKSNPCVILDIDQTAIDQYSLMLKYDFGWFENEICNDLEESMVRTDFPAIPEVLNFSKWLKSNNVYLVFLTSRRDKYRQNTIDQLANAGYSSYDVLITRPTDDSGTIQDFKIRKRKELVVNGYTIIANIGDQQSDLDGGYPAVDCCFKLPNPFYLITADM